MVPFRLLKRYLNVHAFGEHCIDYCKHEKCQNKLDAYANEMQKSCMNKKNDIVKYQITMNGHMV